MTEPRLSVARAHTSLPDEREAVEDLAAQLGPADASLVLFFCSPHYDLEKLGSELATAFSCPVAGCTSAGQIASNGYVRGGISAVSLTSKELRATPYLITPLTDSTQATEVGYRAVAELVRKSSRKGFGLLLIDGLANAEERITAALFEALGDVPIVGGSAADDWSQTGTFVYHQGAFQRDAAVFVLFDTTLPFATFKVQHVTPGEQKLVITEADSELRVVHEINGKPAALEYARAVGVTPRQLDSSVRAEHPLILSIGGQHFVRAIRDIHSDGSMSFACAVEVGLVLTMGQTTPALRALQEGFANVATRVPDHQLVIAFDCALRHREFERRGETAVIGQFLAERRVFGFCSYGEQFDAMHMNQTFTAVALGA